MKVADSGPGVKQENRQLIFERFRQLEGGSTRKFGGTGLGLAIVKDFLEMHGGTITVEDAPQGGALFTVAIPVKAPEGVEVHKQTVLEAGYIEDLTQPVLDEIRPHNKPQTFISKDDSYPLILVVEDNADLNRFITKTLSGLYRVASAMDGQEGLEKALKLNPDLILSDVMMPRMSGDQMVEELRRHPHMKQIPIVLLTAKADDSLRVKMLSGGVQDYLVKPFSAQELKARVSNLIAMEQAKEILQQDLNSKNADIAQLAKEAVMIKRELQQNYTELQRVNNDLDNFVYTASHDLRSPIANLEGLHQMLSKKMVSNSNLNDQEKRILTMMAESVSKLRRTIDDLSQVAKVQKEEVPQETLLFKDLIEEVKMDLSDMINQSGAQIRVALQAQTLSYSHKHLRSILYNLLSNALKYRSAERSPLIEVSTQNGEEGVSLSVKDNGLGLEEKQANKLFQIFKRFHTHVEGSGIGLYIVKRIVENNGGSISVHTQLGKGSEFTIFFQSVNQTMGGRKDI
jgi:signal transduction histidine kinase